MPDTHYLVCKLHLWDDFAVVVHGVKQRLWQPEDSGIVGFIPVYDDHEVAIAESNGLDIIALMINTRDGSFHKHEGEPE